MNQLISFRSKVSGRLPFVKMDSIVGGSIIFGMVEWEDRELFHRNKTHNSPQAEVDGSPHTVHIGK